jgi:hypothetical protein
MVLDVIPSLGERLLFIASNMVSDRGLIPFLSPFWAYYPTPCNLF